MIPKFRAWGVERYPGLKQPAPKMHRNVSVVTTYSEGITFVLTDFNMWGDDEYSGSIIDDAILMQSTGILDKNSQEIFEGDIITNGQNVMCMKRHSTLGFYVEEKGEVEFIADSAVLEEFEEDAKEIADSLEIIGNVYENKELLEEKE